MTGFAAPGRGQDYQASRHDAERDSKTAETHRSNIMLKLKLHSIAELVLYAVRNEIVHVQLPAVLRFPNPGMAERTLPLQGVN